jgi:sterol desaturase/sphingolipid hydroxylase (fatty acid hydroxylase superfamily)
MIYFGTVLSLSLIVVALERRKVFGAFKRSRQLISGSFGQVFGVIVLMSVFFMPFYLFTEVGKSNIRLGDLLWAIYLVFFMSILIPVWVTLYHKLLESKGKA